MYNMEHQIGVLKSKSSILTRVRDRLHTSDRYRYDTLIDFDISDLNVKARFAVDTGSPITVVRYKDVLHNIGNKVALEAIKACRIQKKSADNTQAIKESIQSASGQSIDLVPIVATNFQLTNDICIPRLKIYVSNKIKSSVLGLDILGNFRTIWDWQRGNMLVEATIVDWEERLEKIQKLCKKNISVDYLDPDFIYLIDKVIRYKVVARLMQDDRLLGYRLIDNNGNKKDLNVDHVIELAHKESLTNVTLCKIEGRPYLRGKGCQLSKLPIIKLNRFNIGG